MLFFVCFLFFFSWRLNEVVILSADGWVCILLLFVVLMRRPSQGATGVAVGWCWVLYSRGLFCVSSRYLILPRVSSLVVQGLGVSASTPKAQGLVSWHVPDRLMGSVIRSAWLVIFADMSFEFPVFLPLAYTLLSSIAVSSQSSVGKVFLCQS